MFNSNAWAANILGCREEEADARIKVASSKLEIKDGKKYRRGIDPAAWPELIENGGALARLWKLAAGHPSEVDPLIQQDAITTLAEIEAAFAAYTQEKDTDKYCLKLLCVACGVLQRVVGRELLDELIPDHRGIKARKNYSFSLECGHNRTKECASDNAARVLEGQ